MTDLLHLCGVCDRPFCSHTSALRYVSRTPDAPAPITTATGEAMRQEALRVLTERYKVLAESSKRYSFSPIEGTVMDATGIALDTLTGMAPTGPLIPSHAKDWFTTGAAAS